MRRLYKLISWDYETNRGLATDGTKFDREPITFDVYQQDLSIEHNGHLIIEEVFSAVESPDRALYDIVIERGPRAAQQVKPGPDVLNDDQVESIVAASLNPEAQVGFTPMPIEVVLPVQKTLADLNSRVSKLERILVDRSDDHK